MQTSDRVGKFSVTMRKGYLLAGAPAARLSFIQLGCNTATEWAEVANYWFDTSDSTRARFMQHINHYYATQRPAQ